MKERKEERDRGTDPGKETWRQRERVEAGARAGVRGRHTQPRMIGTGDTGAGCLRDAAGGGAARRDGGTGAVRGAVGRREGPALMPALLQSSPEEIRVHP